jgi:guanine deaminase
MSKTILRGRLLHWCGDPFETGAEALSFHEDGAVVFADGLIAAVGAADKMLTSHPDGTLHHHPKALITPGFIDAHVHYPQTGIIGAWGRQLIDWLNRYTFPEEMRFADPIHAQSMARLFFAEQLRNGFTTCASFCTTHPVSVDAFFEEAARLGVRAVGGKVMMDRNAPSGLLDDAQTGHDQSTALINRWHGRQRLTYALSPRFAPTCSPEQLEASWALWTSHRDCLLQTHLSETIAELDWVAGLFPAARDYLDVYDRFGLLGPRSIFGHGIHLSPREKARLAETGAAIAHCPTSNAYLGSGACDVAGLHASGITVGLGTDTGGGSSFSPFATMRAAYEAGQAHGHALTPAQLWWLASVGSARALHLSDRVGNLAPGLEADAVIIDTEATPLLAERAGRAETPDDLLFALTVLGDDRAIRETWSGGVCLHSKG